jgi:hypothetical protein
MLCCVGCRAVDQVIRLGRNQVECVYVLDDVLASHHIWIFIKIWRLDHQDWISGFMM